MALTLIVECSMCGTKKPIELDIEGPKDLDPQALKKRIEKYRGWHVQFNGDHMDTYCSKKCAE